MEHLAEDFVSVTETIPGSAVGDLQCAGSETGAPVRLRHTNCALPWKTTKAGYGLSSSRFKTQRDGFKQPDNKPETVNVSNAEVSGMAASRKTLKSYSHFCEVIHNGLLLRHVA